MSEQSAMMRMHGVSCVANTRRTHACTLQQWPCTMYGVCCVANTRRTHARMHLATVAMYNVWGVLCGKHTSHARMHLATVAMYSSPNLLVTVVKRSMRLLTLTRGCPRHTWVLRMAWHLAITAWSQQHSCEPQQDLVQRTTCSYRARRNWNTQCPRSRLDPIATTTDAYPSDARGNMHRKVVAQLHADLYRSRHTTSCSTRCQMHGAIRAHAHAHTPCNVMTTQAMHTLTHSPTYDE
jgi:hypothetical protein